MSINFETERIKQTAGLQTIIAFAILLIFFYLVMALYAQKFKNVLEENGIENKYISYLVVLLWATFAFVAFFMLFGYKVLNYPIIYVIFSFIGSMLLIADCIVFYLFYNSLDFGIRESIMPYIQYWHLMAIFVILAVLNIAGFIANVIMGEMYHYPKTPLPPPPSPNLYQRVMDRFK